MEDVIATKHAVKRIRERLGINKSGAQREAERAIKGLRVEDCSGALRRHLDHMRHLHGLNNDYRVTGNAVYVFKGVYLVTVLPLPKAHAKSAVTQWKRHSKKLSSISSTG